MNCRKRTFLCVATVLAAVSCGVAAENASQKSTAAKSLAAAIDTAVQEQIKKYNIPGLTIAVTQGNRIVYSHAFGWADLENRVRATPDTLFRIGSITKPITATAAFIFAERGKLDLDAPVQLYCSSFPEKPEPVTTTRQLLAHLGGVRGFRTDNPDFPEIFNATHYDRLYKSIALFANDPFVAKPGTRYEYSHYGYELVGCVLEGAALHDFEYVLHVGIFGEGGMVGPMLNFKDVLSGVVFTPAGMNSTRLDDVTEIIPNRSRSYTHAKDKTIRNARYLDTSNRMAAAGLLSTANDLARFAIALDSGKLLPASAVRMMWREQQTEDGTQTGYGLGWMIRDHNGTLVAAHTGELPGASSILYIMPDKHISFVVLANTDAAGLWPLANQLADVLTRASER